jgi:hypothetical protein
VAASMERVTDQMRGLNDEIRQTNDEAREMLVALGLLDEDEGPVAYTRAAREAEVVTRDWAAAQRMLADESSRASIAAAQAQADATAAALQRQSQEWEAYAERTAATQVQIQESITAIEAEYAAQRQEAQTLALQMGAETALQTIGDVAQLQLDALEKEVQARQGRAQGGGYAAQHTAGHRERAARKREDQRGRRRARSWPPSTPS